MKKYKYITRFLYYFILVAIIFFVVQQIVFNPLMLFKKYSPQDIDNSKLLINESYLVQKYLLRSKNEYNSFIIGPSTSGNVVLNNENNGIWFNFSFAYFSLWETERLLKEMKKKGIKIKNLVIAISEENGKCIETYNYFENCKLRFGLEYFPMPFSFKEKMYFYSKNFFTFPAITVLTDRIKEFVNGQKKEIYIPQNDFYYTDEEVLEKLMLIKEPFSKNRIKNIKEINDFAKENDINIIFYFVPVYHQVYKLGNINDYNNFKREIAEITPFYDFSGLNLITQDNKMWINLMHSNDKTGELIKQRLFSPKTEAPLIKDFGIYVTKDNIDNHIKLMTEQVKNSNK